MFHTIGVIIIGGLMLYGLMHVINSERERSGKEPLGCGVTLIIIIIVIAFWYFTSKLV